MSLYNTEMRNSSHVGSFWVENVLILLLKLVKTVKIHAWVSQILGKFLLKDVEISAGTKYLEKFYLNSTLKFGIPPVLVFQLVRSLI